MAQAAKEGFTGAVRLDLDLRGGVSWVEHKDDVIHYRRREWC